MIERFVKVSWKINTKTGTAEDITIDMQASAMEEATAACIMARHACETIAQTSGKEKARKCLLETVKLALDAPDEEIKTQARARGVVTQQRKDGGDNE